MASRWFFLLSSKSKRAVGNWRFWNPVLLKVTFWTFGSAQTEKHMLPWPAAVRMAVNRELTVGSGVDVNPFAAASVYKLTVLAPKVNTPDCAAGLRMRRVRNVASGSRYSSQFRKKKALSFPLKSLGTLTRPP